MSVMMLSTLTKKTATSRVNNISQLTILCGHRKRCPFLLSTDALYGLYIMTNKSDRSPLEDQADFGLDIFKPIIVPKTKLSAKQTNSAIEVSTTRLTRIAVSMKQTAWHDIIESILFFSKIFKLFLVNNVSGHSPYHRLVKVTGLYVGIIWLVSVQRHLTINF